MPESLPRIYLARHGETAWSVSGQHTGRTDLPLTARGEQNARRLGELLAGLQPARVITSPLERARRTCELAGFGSVANIDPDLVEWDYGAYEGKTPAEIRRDRPGWEIFRDGCPGGESLAQVAARADRVVVRLRAIGADVLVFSSGHLLRVLAARWLGLDGALGRYFFLEAAALSILGYQRDLTEPVIRLWNDCRHLALAANVATPSGGAAASRPY
jgi:probable phosphoglycerate mutase